MTPTIDVRKGRNGKMDPRNDNHFNSLPHLEPILQFDGEDSGLSGDESDQIDGAIISIMNNNRNLECMDVNEEDINNDDYFDATQTLVRKQAPTFLLIESLIWNICTYYESERNNQKKLYLTLCKRLEKYKIIGTSYRSESLQPIRDLIAVKFNEFIKTVRTDDHSIKSKCMTPSMNTAIKSNALLDSEANLINLTSRYADEFEDMGVIEEGGFGIVKKSRHLFDNCEYAVKLIKFRYKTDTDFMKITREVQLYANLCSHPNVVAYKTAWLENWFLGDEKTPLSKLNPLNELKNNANNTDDDSISFEESSKSGIRIESKEIKLTEKLISPQSSTNDYDEESHEDSDDDDVDDSSRSCAAEQSDDLFMCRSPTDYTTVRFGEKRTLSMTSTKPQYSPCNKVEKYCREMPRIQVNDELEPKEFSFRNFAAILYIQMELCGKNLKTWIRQRNDRIFAQEIAVNPTVDKCNHIDSIASLNIFKQVLKGVHYIHSQHLIHRDLKPQNILFSTDESKVKIGDFGLATLHSSINNEEISLDCSEQSSQQIHTGGIGTSIYAAPEQRTGHSYDYKADLYSLGVILFELFYPLSTDMEKNKCVSDINKKRKLPVKFQKRWPIVAEVVLSLTDPKPSLRPNAAQVLQSSIFLTKEQLIIKQLEEQLISVKIDSETKGREIDRLKSALAYSQQEILHKDIEIQALKTLLRLKNGQS